MLFIIGALMIGVSFVFALVPQLAALPIIGGFVAGFVTWIELIVFMGGAVVGVSIYGISKRGLIAGFIIGIIVVIIMLMLGGLV